MSGEYFARATVRRVVDVAPDVRLIELVPDAGVAPYPPGSHIDIAVSIGGIPDTRSYSLVGEPDGQAYRIAVKQVPDSRGGSRVVRALSPGQEALISAPKSHFELAHGRPEYLLVAGGIGITPLIGMAQALHRHGRSFRLLYSARTRAQLAFADELRELLGERLELFVDAEGTRIEVAARIAALDPDAELYLCGPQGMRDAVARAWLAAGRRADRLRFETFASGGRFAPQEFVVRAADLDGAEFVVARETTMLDALAEQGVELMWDCRRGECGLCAVSVLACEGELDHRDVFLSESQRAQCRTMLACVSRAVGGAVTIDSGFRSDPERPRSVAMQRS